MNEQIADNTPILVGVGQVSDKRGQPDYRALSPTAIAAEAAIAACEDALSLAALGPQVDLVASVRTTADSRPGTIPGSSVPFGSPENVPGAVAARLGASQAAGVYSPACGDEPQKLINEFCERLHAGELRLVVVCGGEATSTLRAAMGAGEKHDWAEQADNELDDRGPQTESMRSDYMAAHKLAAPLFVYPLFDQARRKRLGLSSDAYRQEIGRLFSPFTKVAAANPHAFSQKALSVEQIATVTEDNRMIADPHTRLMVAREQVNLGAAVVLTTVGAAREMGIPQDKWVYLHGYSSTHERAVLDRRDLGRSPAMAAAYRGALDAAGVGIEDIGYIDIYSCFPIAVFAAIDALGLQSDDPRGLTLTGGLPYFGGPGNNYSMHAIAEMAGRLRRDRDAIGLVGCNGGFLSTHAAGVYSTKPKAWANCDSTALQAEVDAEQAPVLVERPSGEGRIESYTVLYERGAIADVVVVGRLDDDSRFLAVADGDIDTIRSFTEQDAFDRRITVANEGSFNRFRLVA